MKRCFVDKEEAMNDREAIDMMQRCAAEITSLRQQIKAIAPKADAYDSITAILRLLPVPSQGMSEDLVWSLRKRIEELSKPATPAPDETAD
jgi:hypothetical protein